MPQKRRRANSNPRVRRGEGFLSLGGSVVNAANKKSMDDNDAILECQRQNESDEILQFIANAQINTYKQEAPRPSIIQEENSKMPICKHCGSIKLKNHVCQ